MADNTIINPGSGGDAIATDDIGGVKFQRVKVTHGADGSATDVSSASPLPVDTELPAAAALSDSTANPTAPMVGAAGMVWNGSAWVRAASATALGDGASPIGSLAVGNYLNVPGGNNWSRAKSIDGKGDADTGSGVAAESPMLYNGSTFDRERGNTEGTLLASAARTASLSSAAQTNYNARGVIITVRVTSAGTGTLRVLIASNDPASGLGIWYPLDSATGTSANVSAVGVSPYFLYPGAGAVTDTLVVKKAVSLPLPRYWLVEVIPSDASSWTYSIGYSLIV